MAKKPTITCKVCGGEHAGLICTKFKKEPNQGRVLAGLLAAPKPEKAPPAKKAKKVKKKKRTKKRTPKQAPAPQAIIAPAETPVVATDIQPDNSKETT